MPLSLFLAYTLWLLFLILILMGLIVFVGTMVLSMYGNAPFIPTPEKSIRAVLELAKLQKGEKVYDLGSGDGRILTFAATHYGARGMGVEQNFVLVWLSHLRARIGGHGEVVKTIRGDIFDADLGDADVVILYLLPITNKKLEHKLQTELRPGTRVVSRHFTFPNWKPAQVDRAEKLSLYIV